MPALRDAAGNIRFGGPKFPGQHGKEDYMLVTNGSLWSARRFAFYDEAGNVIDTHEHAGDFKE
jgi:hypothetical protein